MAILAGIHFTCTQWQISRRTQQKPCLSTSKHKQNVTLKKYFYTPVQVFIVTINFWGFIISVAGTFYVWLLFQASSCEIVLSRASFPERPSNFLGKKTNFKIKTCLIVVHFLAPKLVNFALLTDSFFLSFSETGPRKPYQNTVCELLPR